MADLILMGRGASIENIPLRDWERELSATPEHIARRLEFMSCDHHLVRNFVVRELPRLGRPISLAEISHALHLTRELYVERDDFMEDAPKKFFRLSLGREVRLRYAYYIICTDVIKDDNGEVIELICTYDPATRGGDSPDGRKVKGTIHWVSAQHAIDARVNLYDRLFTHPNPGGSDNYIEHLNPDSLQTLTRCKLEPSLLEATTQQHYQFERKGYVAIAPDGIDQDNMDFAAVVKDLDLINRLTLVLCLFYRQHPTGDMLAGNVAGLL